MVVVQIVKRNLELNLNSYDNKDKDTNVDDMMFLIDDTSVNSIYNIPSSIQMMLSWPLNKCNLVNQIASKLKYTLKYLLIYLSHYDQKSHLF